MTLELAHPSTEPVPSPSPVDPGHPRWWFWRTTSGRILVSGVVLSAYSARGGVSGDLGAPIGDEQNRQQNFEGGSISYASGSPVVTATPRQPSVSATPSTVIPGSKVHLVLGGFQNGATVRVSVTGQPDFIVTVPSGAYVWDTLAPSQSDPSHPQSRYSSARRRIQVPSPPQHRTLCRRPRQRSPAPSPAR